MPEQQGDMTDQELFVALLFSLHAAGMQQLGKVMNPLTGKIERDLQQARATIDMVEMLKRRTEGNLSDSESKLLGRLLYELQMNYVDEARSEQNTGTTEGEKGKNQAGTQTEGP